MKRISLFVLVLGMLLTITACIPDIVGRKASGNSQPTPTLQPVEKILSPFNPVKGTNILMAGIISSLYFQKSSQAAFMIFRSVRRPRDNR